MAHTKQSLIHEYFSQIKDKAEIPSKSLHFKGTKLFSYDSWIADIREAPSGTYTFININIEYCSATTKKHVAQLITNSSYPVRYWDFSKSNYVNINLKFSKIESLIKTHSRARSNKSVIQEEIKSIYKDIKSLMSEYDVPEHHMMHQKYHKLAFKLFSLKLI